MKATDPKIWLAIVTALGVVALVVIDLGRTSPGPLSLVHDRESALTARAGCELCHGAADSTMAAACGECHAEVARQIAERSGFHGTLESPQNCATCHTEHHGREVELSGAAAFAAAGIPDRARYDHAGLDMTLAGRHTELACADCHPLADVGHVPKGGRRFLGLEQRCVACHEDPHDGRMERGCAECHGQEHPFANAAAFEHVDHFQLVGAHGQLACVECHAKGGERSIEVLGGAGPVPADRACVDCHESPHSDPFVARVAAQVGRTAPDACAECHPTVHGGFADFDLERTRALHGNSGFALVAPHADVACEACHEGAHGYADRRAEDCAACHADPHGSQFGNQACLDCHDRHAFAPHEFDLLRHAEIGFALEASHAEATCESCHRVPDDDAHAARRFRGTPDQCADCHADSHAGAFDVGCGACHTTVSFADGARASFDHFEATGFALDGAHARSDCESCHEPSEHPDVFGRRLGRIAELFGTPTNACETCHTDVHAGAFAQDCSECHVTDAFAPARAGFDHGSATGFALEGAHGRAGCEACHARSAHPDIDGRTLGRVAELFGRPTNACETCHADVHAGAFEAAQGCVECHVAESFGHARADFAHGASTGFALGAAHAAAACEACHVPTLEPDALGRRFGRVDGTSCEDCHADPHAGQFRADERTDCASCHAVAHSFSELVFDHSRDARFALDERHAKLACNACHLAYPRPGGGEVVRYKPLGTSCGDCHGNIREDRR